MRKSTIVLAAAAALCFVGAARAGEFAMGFDCPANVEMAPGETRNIEAFVTIDASNFPEEVEPGVRADGAQGWSVGVAIEGDGVPAPLPAAVITGRNVIVDTRFFGDLDPDDEDETKTLVEHHPFEVRQSFFTSLAAANGNWGPPEYPNPSPIPGVVGAIGAVVLGDGDKRKIVLQPNGHFQVLKVTIAATVPPSGQGQIRLRYVDGLRSVPNTQGKRSEPVANVVTYNGDSINVTKGLVLNTCTINIGSPPPAYKLAIVGAETDPFPAAPDNVIARTVTVADPTEHNVFVKLRTERLPATGDGPQGWSLSIAHDPCLTYVSQRIRQVIVSTIFFGDPDPDDEDETKQNIDPWAHDLNDSFFTVNNAATLATSYSETVPTDGLISAAVLGDGDKRKIVLHTNAEDNLLRITYRVAGLAPNETRDCKINFRDGLRGILRAQQKLAEPTNNVVTYQGDSKNPEKGLVTQSAILRVTRGPDTPQASNYVSGDPNDDGKHDIADAVTIVSHIIGSPAGGQVECTAALDADGQNGVNIQDAVHIINWQFRGGAPPAAPFPGCGPGSATPATCPPGSVEECRPST